MLRIGYDAKRLFNNFTGLGNYSRTLLKDLATYYPEEAYFLFSAKFKENKETQFFLNNPMFEVKAYQGVAKSWWRTKGIVKDLKAAELSIYHGLSHEIPLGLAKSGIKSVVTIHDLVFKHYPAHYKRIDRLFYDKKFKYACQHADIVLAISESTKKDIIQFYNTPSEKIKVIYQSCGRHFLQKKSPKIKDAILQKYNLPKSFFLYVGSIIERKNLLGIIKAMALTPRESLLPLVIIGGESPYKKVVLEFAIEKKLDHLLLFKKVSYEDLPTVYQSAHLFLYPSFYEGFGIPVLEALVSKVPIITSNISSLPEAGGSNSALVDPSNYEEMAVAIQAVSSDENRRIKMKKEGFEYAQKFSGDYLGAQLMNVYTALVNK